MLSVAKITNGVYFFKQDKAIHPLSTSNGYLIVPSQIQNNSISTTENSILVDVNLEEEGWIALKTFCDKNSIPSPKTLIMTHCHLDHSCHVHLFVKIFDGNVIAPEPEVSVILEQDGFLNVYQIHEMQEIPSLLESYHHLKYEILQFDILPENKATTFQPGTTFDFGTICIKTIPLTAHSVGHIGLIFSFPDEETKIFHNSCLGLDQLKLNKEGIPKDGFGPWYGFKHNTIEYYLTDIDKSESHFQECDVLTSSHGIIFSRGSISIKILQGNKIYIKILPQAGHFESPFDYMRRKIQEREEAILVALEKLDVHLDHIHKVNDSSVLIGKLLDMDIIFSQNRISVRQIPAYKFWERHLIMNHLKRLENKYIHL